MPERRKPQFQAPCYSEKGTTAKDVYRRWRERGDLPEVEKEIKVALRGLEKPGRESLRQAFEQFDSCDAFMDHFPMGHLHQMATLKADQFFVNYLHRAIAGWNGVFEGIHDPWPRLDPHTTARMRLLAPASSIVDAEEVRYLFQPDATDQRVFDEFSDGERPRILANVLEIKYPLLDLRTFVEDLKLLRHALHCVRTLLSPEHRWKAPPELVEFALKNLENLHPKVVLYEKKPRPPRSMATWREFARLAEDHHLTATVQPRPSQTLQGSRRVRRLRPEKDVPQEARQGRPSIETATRLQVYRDAVARGEPPHSPNIITAQFVRESKIVAFIERVQYVEYSDVFPVDDVYGVRGSSRTAATRQAPRVTSPIYPLAVAPIGPPHPYLPITPPAAQVGDAGQIAQVYRNTLSQPPVTGSSRYSDVSVVDAEDDASSDTGGQEEDGSGGLESPQVKTEEDDLFEADGTAWVDANRGRDASVEEARSSIHASPRPQPRDKQIQVFYLEGDVLTPGPQLERGEVAKKIAGYSREYLVYDEDMRYTHDSYWDKDDIYLQPRWICLSRRQDRISLPLETVQRHANEHVAGPAL